MICRDGWVTIVLLWGLVATGFSQEIENVPATSHFEKITGGREFVKGTVLEILEDHQGMIWIGTGNGLARYDGYKYKWFRNNPLDSGSLYQNWVKALILDQKEDVLWLGTDAGISRFDIRTETFQNHFDLLDTEVTAIPPPVLQLSQDSDGRIWIGTIAEGLLCYDPSTRALRRYRHQPETLNGLSADFVTHTFHDNTGKVWINTNNGIDILDPATNHFKHIDARKAIQDATGRMWLFSQNRLRCFDPATGQWTDSPDSELLAPYIGPMQPVFVDDRPRLWIDKNNHLWAAEDQTLIRYQLDRRQLTVYQQEAGVPQSSIWCLYLDSQHSIWLGTMGDGYYRMDGQRKKFRNYLTADETGEPLRNIAGDRAGGCWVALNGLFHFDLVSGSLEPYSVNHPEFQQLPRYHINCFLSDSKNNLWIGTLWGGLFRLHPETGEFFHLEDLGANDLNQVEQAWITALLEDRQGRIWIASNDKIYVYHPASDSLLSLPHTATCLREDPQGMIWAGTYGGILLRIHPVGMQVSRHQLPDASTGEIKDLLTDASGRVWIVSYGSGLMCLEPEAGISSFRQWREYNSNMPTDLLYTLESDEKGRLWIGAEYGLIRFDPAKEQVTGFFTKDETGISAALLDSWKDNEGNLYFGSPSGLLTFHPDSITINPHPPRATLTGFLLFNQSVPVAGTYGDTLGFNSPLRQSIRYTDYIDLAYWQNDIAFEFTALSYTTPQKTRYAYRLEGYDKDWIYADSDQRIAHYTNLDPGSYRFRVKAANNDGVWNQAGAAVSLSISPPWWTTWWAWLLYGIAFFLIILGVYRYQLGRQLALAEAERLTELDKVKSRLYTNITHEFRTPLTVILGITDLIKDQVGKPVKEHLQIVQRNGQGLLKMVNHMLDLARLESGHLELKLVRGDILNYLQYLLESFHSLAESKEIELQFQSELEALYMDYDPERLMHVISNLLSNAIKFTPEGGKVQLEVLMPKDTNTGEILIIKVRDTGAGIPAGKLPHIFDRFYQADGSSTRTGGGAGIGLTLTKELVQLMDGKVDVKSTPGKGTVFTLYLPVRREAKLIEENNEDLSGLTGGVQPSPVIIHDRSKKIRGSESTTKGRPQLLIIEDHSDMVRYLVSCLQPAYHLEVAGNGREGIDKAVDMVPDLILTDVMMPEKDGFEVCETLKNHELTSHIPIIMLTAKVDVASRLTGLQRGADAYLAKPFLRRELEIRIQALLEQRQRLQAYYRTVAGISEENIESSPSREAAAPEDEFLKKITRIIERNLENENFTVEQLSKEAFVSSSGLYRKLTALTGMNPNRYIRSFRLGKAKELLRNGAKPVAVIAFETGFKDPDYFSRIFKKEIGKTPSQWRRSFKNSNKPNQE